MEPAHIEELKQNHISSEADWAQFQSMYMNFPEAIHPQIRGTDCGLALLLWTVALMLLLGIFYVMFIIFQLSIDLNECSDRFTRNTSSSFVDNFRYHVCGLIFRFCTAQIQTWHL